MPSTTASQLLLRGVTGARAFATIVIASVALFGCASDEESVEDAFLNGITEAYETAQTSMGSGNYRRASQILEELQARFPFSDLSKQIQLELMYAYYKNGSQEQSIDAADTFI